MPKPKSSSTSVPPSSGPRWKMAAHWASIAGGGTGLPPRRYQPAIPHILTRLRVRSGCLRVGPHFPQRTSLLPGEGRGPELTQNWTPAFAGEHRGCDGRALYTLVSKLGPAHSSGTSETVAGAA